MINIPKMKLSKKHTEKIKRYKASSAEEKEKTEDEFIKAINDKESKFYSPTLANMNGYELRAMIKLVASLIDTGDDTND